MYFIERIKCFQIILKLISNLQWKIIFGSGNGLVLNRRQAMKQSCSLTLISPHPSESAMTNGYPNSKVHGANMGPIWGRQDPGGPHAGPMNFAIWVPFACGFQNLLCCCPRRSFRRVCVTNQQTTRSTRAGCPPDCAWIFDVSAIVLFFRNRNYCSKLLIPNSIFSSTN